MALFTFDEIQELESLMKVRGSLNDLEKKYLTKTQKHIQKIKYIPWLRMIAIWNSIAMKSSHKDSDIDLFVVTEKNRLWIVRICITLYFSIIWLRKTWKQHSGAFCLSFFVTPENLDFSDIAIDNDIYLFYWILTLKPILDYNNTYNDFIEKNTWGNFDDFSEYFKNSKEYISVTENKKQRHSIFLNSINAILKKIFSPKTERSYQKLWKPFWVIISDNMLKFHNNDKRKYFSDNIGMKSIQNPWKKKKNP